MRALVVGVVEVGLVNGDDSGRAELLGDEPDDLAEEAGSKRVQIIPARPGEPVVGVIEDQDRLQAAVADEIEDLSGCSITSSP